MAETTKANNESTSALTQEYIDVVCEAAKLPEKEQRNIALILTGYLAARKTEAAVV